MATNPDLTPYIDLSLFDKTPEQIVAIAVTTLQSRLPEWTPQESNLEMALIEAMALEISETTYLINRLPNTMLEIMLTLYGVTRGQGTAPSVDLTFTMTDTAGYVIPANTEVSVPISLSQNLSFFTNTALSIIGGSYSGTVTATAKINSTIANGVVAGTIGILIDGLPNVQTVVTDTDIAGGVDPEATATWLARGIERLQRLTDTLVIPSHFTDMALEQTYVNRANTIDNFDISLGTGVPGDHPGHVSVLVYGFGSAVSSPNKTDLLTKLQDAAISNLGVHIADPTLTTIAVTCTVKKLDSYTTLQVTNNLTDALNLYLNPNYWAWSGVVRRNELIALISSVAGVDYLVSLTTPAADVTIGLDTVLVDVGTLTLTVT